MIINANSYEYVKKLEDDSIDLVVTSPPYNVDLGNNKYNKNKYNSYEDNLPHKEYLNQLRGMFADLMPKLKSGARVCINIGAKANGRIATHSDIIQFMNELGYLNVTQIIWDKSQVGNRTSWGSFCSPSCPSFPTPFEYILVFAKDSLKLQEKGETDLTKEEFIDWSLALWRFAPECQMKKFGHPAMFPKELPKRLIKLFSWKGATVLDPFSGLGTTGVVCRELGRKYIGIEMDLGYCEKSIERINNTEVNK